MTDFMKLYREFLAEKPPLEELKNFCRKYKIRGFSQLKKQGIRDLIEKAGKAKDAAAIKATKHDKDMNDFFSDAEAQLAYKPTIKEHVKQNKNDMNDFLMIATKRLNQTGKK